MAGKVANRRQSSSLTGTSSTAKTGMPSSGRPCSDQARAVRCAWRCSLATVARPPRTTTRIGGQRLGPQPRTLHDPLAGIGEGYCAGRLWRAMRRAHCWLTAERYLQLEQINWWTWQLKGSKRDLGA
jgi:hypothetical protein